MRPDLSVPRDGWRYTGPLYLDGTRVLLLCDLKIKGQETRKVLAES